MSYRVYKGGRIKVDYLNNACINRPKWAGAYVEMVHLTLIVAVSENGVIGNNNTLPWYLPDDLKRFRRLTTGYPMIMGRNTFESLPNILPGRTHIVLSRNPEYKPKGVTVVHSVFEALEAVSGEEKAFVIGGEQIYRLFMDFCSRIEMTRVHRVVQGDAILPPLPECFVETSRETTQEASYIQWNLE